MTTKMATRPVNRQEMLQLAFWFLVFSDILLLGWWNMLLPAATLILLLILLGSGVVWVIVLRRHGFEIMRTSLDGGMLLLLLALLVTAWFSIDPSRSWRFVWQWVGCIWLFYLTVTLFRAGWSRTAFAKGLLMTLVVTLIGAYYQLYGLVTLWYEAGPWPTLLPPALPRVWGLTVSPNVIAIMLVMGVLVSVGYWRGTDGPKPKPLVAWFMVVSPMLILPASRSGWLALIVGLFVYVGLFLWRRPAGQRLSRSTIQKLIGAAAGSLLLLLVLTTLLRGQTLSLDRLDSAFYRTGFWQVAFDTWLSAPLVGTGLNTYSTHYILANDIPYDTLFVAAHNIFFQVLADMGLLGLGAVLLIAGQTIHRLARCDKRKLDERLIGLLAALAAYGVHSLFDTPETWIMALAALLLGAVVARLSPEPAFIPALSWIPALWLLSWIALLLTGVLGYQISQQYFLATQAAEEGEWDRALTHLDVAQTLLPYDDSSLLAFSAIIKGGLAATNPAYLAEAIAESERLVALEPGWGAHRANLASLYWQSGDPLEAIDVMAHVVADAPEVGVYRLNLLRWFEATDSPSEWQDWQALADIRQVWSAAPLFLERGITPAAAPEPDAATLLLAGDLELARRQYEQRLDADPYDPEALVGVAMVQLQMGQEIAAAHSLRQAAAIFRFRGVGGNGGTTVQLWQALLPSAPADRLDQMQARLSEQSPYGPGYGGQGSYTLTTFLRLSPPSDLLPQLHCFATADVWAHSLLQIQAWEAREEALAAEWVEPLLYGSGDGTVACWQVAE